MSEDRQDKSRPESLLAGWLQATSEFWSSAMKSWPGMPENEQAHQAAAQWEPSLQMWQSLVSMMSEPGAMDGILKGMNALPEVGLKVANSTWNGFFFFQQQWLERMGELGERAEAYKFENAGEKMFDNWMEVYEKEFRQFLKIPQLGLARFYQERSAEALDRFNILQAAAAELSYLFYLPMEKSMRIMQDKLKEGMEKGEMSDNLKDYYQMWIKTLEGHYMTLFKSPEFSRSLNNTVDALEEFQKAKQAVVYDLLQNLPIPTNRDLDELSREIYLLKKKVRELDKKLNGSPS